MRPINLNEELLKYSRDNKKYLILGSDKMEDSIYVEENVVPKIKRDRKDAVDGFWGTLGFADDNPIDWTGTLKFSRIGNGEFERYVADEVERIKLCIPNLNVDPSSIIQRFISFEDVEIKMPDLFALDQIPKLRLNLMLDSDEGALMFYQAYKDMDVKDDIVYIQPEATKGNNTRDRDRLKYIFDIVPKFLIIEDDEFPTQYKLKKRKRREKFIVKIITFKRTYSNLKNEQRLDSKVILKQAQYVINKIIQDTDLPKDHRLLLFNRDKNNFHEPGKDEISNSKKTLFLMHGTFSDTKGSFGDLFGAKENFLKVLTSANNQFYYDQIIAFDHPTVFYDAKGNIDMLFKCMKDLGIHSFEHEVDFIGTSQGGLIVQYLANLEQYRIKVGKVALVSSANGVGYLSAANYVPKLLTILRKIFTKTGNVAGAFISALAQHSSEFLLEQPGLQLMTPNHEKLTEIIYNQPFRPETIYYPVISDYDKGIFKNKFALLKYFLRIVCTLADNAAKPFLGTYHDLIVGTKEQFIVPQKYCIIPACTPDKYRHFTIKATHGTVFKKAIAKTKLEGFLTNPDFVETLPSFEPSRIDAHCHIHGRDILTPRILFLLVQDIFQFRSEISKNKKLVPIKIVEKKDNQQDNELKRGSVFGNIVKYFILNKDSIKVLDDLSEEYNDLNSGLFRYMPLMFDLEMTFRKNYSNDLADQRIDNRENDFKELLSGYIDDIDELINKFEDLGELVFQGSIEDNLKSIKFLKQIKKVIDLIGWANPKLKQKVKSGYQLQVDEIKVLKKRYGNNLYPFLAVDPRRKNMEQIILDSVGKDKPFYGIKLYAPNGYSPTDPNLFDDSQGFIDGMSLYSYCIKNNIPIMAHCSDAGFSTFVEDVEVWGDININGAIKHYSIPTYVHFNKNLPGFKFDEAVRERAYVLNHPKLWKIVLSKYKYLKICLAHFGGASKEWRAEIADLMERHPNVFTDLSCMVKKKRLQDIKEEYFTETSLVKDRIMYGSDFYLSMLSKIKFEDYYRHFKEVFSEKQLNDMSIKIPEKFLK